MDHGQSVSGRPEFHFEHPAPVFPSEHYLILRELMDAAADENPPCQNHPEMWWETGRATQQLAVDACRTRCAIQEQCLAYALAADEREGVWGGATPEERKAMKPETDTEADEYRTAIPEHPPEHLLLPEHHAERGDLQDSLQA